MGVTLKELLLDMSVLDEHLAVYDEADVTLSAPPEPNPHETFKLRELLESLEELEEAARHAETHRRWAALLSALLLAAFSFLGSLGVAHLLLPVWVVAPALLVVWCLQCLHRSIRTARETSRIGKPLLRQISLTQAQKSAQTACNPATSSVRSLRQLQSLAHQLRQQLSALVAAEDARQ